MTLFISIVIKSQDILLIHQTNRFLLYKLELLKEA